MPVPKDIDVIDLMVLIPTDEHNEAGHKSYAAMQRDPSERATTMPAGYMFKDIPTVGSDPAHFVERIVAEMDRYRITKGLLPIANAEAYPETLTTYKDRFFCSITINPFLGMEEIRRVRTSVKEKGVKAITYFPAASFPQVALNERELYPFYAECIDLDIPFVANVGVPGPRMPLRTQKVELVDEVCWFFPELRFVMRHGAEPWEDLAVKLMLKYPNLYYMTSAFAPRYYPKAIIDFANTRGADKIMYAGYFPIGLTLERIFKELDSLPLKDEVWPKFLHDNAARVFKL